MRENVVISIKGEYSCDVFNAIKLLFDESEDILWLCDFESGTFYSSDRLKLICGYDTDYPLDTLKCLTDIVFVKDRKQLNTMFAELFSGKESKIQSNIRFVCRDGRTKTLEIRGKRSSCLNDRGENQTILSGVFLDTNEKRRLENQLSYVSYYDSLTELPNRSMFAYRTNVAINQRSSENTAVVYLDLDNFKRINDLYGHDTGDDVLVEISKIIKREINSQQILSRLGGDGFLLLVPNNGSEELLYKQIDTILEAVSRPFAINGLEIQMTCSAGVAIFPDDGCKAEELIKNADAAMYKAKKKGRNQWCLFEKSINAEIRRRTEMEKSLRNALNQNELSLVYQPQIECAGGKLKGIEALLRWNSPVYGSVSPMEFIPILEETGLIIPIGNWVMEEAVKQCKRWNDKYQLNVPVSVNVSTIQLKDKQFLPTLLKILDRNNLPSEFMKIEITESTLMESCIKASDTLGLLRKSGIGIALDDFGIGYSSLSYLKSLPLDSLKIDKSFIDNMRTQNREHAIVSSIINLAQVLGLEAVAEGVETREQLECLMESRCNTIQGYFFSKPLPPGAFEDMWVRDRQ